MVEEKKWAMSVLSAATGGIIGYLVRKQEVLSLSLQQPDFRCRQRFRRTAQHQYVAG